MFIINQISPHDAYDTLDVWNAGSEGSCYRGLSFRQGNPRMCCLQGLHTNKPTHQSLKGRLVKGVSMFCRQWSIKWQIWWIRLCQSVSILTSQSLAPSPHMPTLYLAMIQKTALKISLDSHKQINTSHIKIWINSVMSELPTSMGHRKSIKMNWENYEVVCFYCTSFSVIE